MDALFEIILWVVFKPFAALFEALAGIAYPTKPGSALARVQRAAVLFLAIGVLAFLAGVVLICLVGLGKAALLAFVIGFLSMVTAGTLGSYIERKCRSQRTRSQGSFLG